MVAVAQLPTLLVVVAPQLLLTLVVAVELEAQITTALSQVEMVVLA